MKALAILLLISALPAAPQAQQPPPPDAQGPADVAVVKFSWRKERLPGWENNPFGPSFETYEAMKLRVDNERRIQQARNAGNKAEVSRRERDAKIIEDASFPKTPEKGERPRDGYKYKVFVNNAGTKTIKLIDWDYVFSDPETKREVARHQFTSEEKIRPGKGKELGVLILSPPVRTVSAGAVQKGTTPLTEQVVLMRIEYTDGSVWQRQ